MKERALLQREEVTTIARQAVQYCVPGRKECGCRDARFSKWSGEDPRDLLPLVTSHKRKPGATHVYYETDWLQIRCY